MCRTLLFPHAAVHNTAHPTVCHSTLDAPCLTRPHAAAGIDDGQGMLVRTVMGAGLGRQLAEHHVWRRGGLLHGAQLRLAGQPGAPLGGLVEQPTMDADAPAPKKQAVAGRRAEVWDEDSQPVAAWVQ